MLSYVSVSGPIPISQSAVGHRSEVWNSLWNLKLLRCCWALSSDELCWENDKYHIIIVIICSVKRLWHQQNEKWRFRSCVCSVRHNRRWGMYVRYLWEAENLVNLQNFDLEWLQQGFQWRNQYMNTAWSVPAFATYIQIKCRPQKFCHTTHAQLCTYIKPPQTC